MALNFLGLGFNFGAKDDGLTATADKSTSAITKLSDSFSNMGNASSTMGDLLKAGQNLTTGFESMLVQNRKSVSQLAYNLGAPAEQIDDIVQKAQNMQLSIGVSAEHAAESIVEFKKQSDQFAAVGIANATDLAKASDVLGIRSQSLRETLGDLGAMGITNAKDMRELTGQFVEAGRATGNAAAGMEQLNTTMDDLRKQNAFVGKSSDEMVQMAKGVAGVTAALGKMSIKGDDARGLISRMFSTMTQNSVDFKKTFAGTASAIPGLAKELSIVGGSVDKAFEDMQGGPDGMIRGFAKMIQAAKKSGKDITPITKFMSARLAEVMPEQDVARLMSTMSNASDQALDDMTKVVKGADGLTPTVNAFKSNITDAQAMDNMENSFLTGFRAIEKGNATFLKESGKNFQEWGNKLKKISKEGGPLGMMVDKLSELSKKGAIGLLPKEFQGFGQVFATMAQSLGPLLQLLPGLIAAVGVLFSPAGLLLAGGIAVMALYSRFKELEKQLGSSKKAFKQLGDDIKKWMGKALDWVLNSLVSLTDKIWGWVDSVDWEGIFTGMIDAFVSLLDGTDPKGLSKGRLGKIFNNVIKIFSKIGGALLKVIQKTDWNKVADSIKGAIGRIADWVWDSLKRIDWGGIAKLLGDGLTKAWHALVALATDLFKAAGPWLGQKLREFLPWFMDFIGNDLAPWLAKVIPSLLNDLGGLLKSAIGLVKDMIFGIFDGLGDWFKKYFPEYKETIDTVINALKATFDALGTVIDVVIDGVVTAGKFLVDLVLKPVDTIMESFKTLKGISDDLWGSISDWGSKLFKHSIHTDVKKDLGLAGKEFEKFGDDAEKSLKQIGVAAGNPAVSPNGATAAPSPMVPKPALGGDAMSSLVAAVNYPAWWKEYKAMFQAFMAQMQPTAMAGAEPSAPTRSRRPGVPPRSTDPEIGLGKMTTVSSTGVTR